MENKTNKTEPCYIQNADAKSIETEFVVSGHTVKIKQRRLNGGEVEKHQLNLKSVYTDKDIYLSLIKQDGIKEALEKEQKRLSKKKDADLTDINIPIDDETSLLMYRGRVAIESYNRKNNAKFIAYSCNKTNLEDGLFLFDGKEVSFDKKVEIISEFGNSEEEIENDVNYFDLLLANANKLSYATKEEIASAKS